MTSGCVVHVVGARPNFVKMAPVIAALANRPRSASWSSTPASTTTHACPTRSCRTSASPSPTCSSASARARTARRRRACSRRSSASCSTSAPDARVRRAATSTRRSPPRWPPPSSAIPVGARRGRPALVRLDDARGDQPRPHRPALRPAVHAQPRGARRTSCAEGIDAERVHFVGNTMIDSLRRFEATRRATAARGGSSACERGEYVLVTLHRPSNVDEPGSSRRDRRGARGARPRSVPVVFPVHPRTRRAPAGRWARWPASRAPACAARARSATSTSSPSRSAPRAIVTDSGGVQEEATALGRPVLHAAPQHRAPGDDHPRAPTSCSATIPRRSPRIRPAALERRPAIIADGTAAPAGAWPTSSPPHCAANPWRPPA